MATYKVLQDIEADDKLLGPLSLKQFIFLIITVGLLFIQFRIIVSPLGIARWPVLALFLLPTLLFGLLASPIGRDQPTEVWLIARLRFFFKPRRRIWDQDGPKQLVTITAPKRIEKRLTKQFSQQEVSSRLDALAAVMDSRGWAVKNVNVNLNTQPSYLDETYDERLSINTNLMQQDPQLTDVTASDDIMDARSNSTAHHFDQMIMQAEAEHKRSLQDKIASARDHKKAVSTPYPSVQSSQPSESAADEWFAQQKLVQGGSGQSYTPNTTPSAVPAPQPAIARPAAPVSRLTADDERALLDKMHDEQKQQAAVKNGLAHLKTIPTLDDKLAEEKQRQIKAAEEEARANLNNQNLARDNDKTVETLARQAKKSDDGEVIINLH